MEEPKVVLSAVFACFDFFVLYAIGQKPLSVKLIRGEKASALMQPCVRFLCVQFFAFGA